jgi:hypothetical protein
MSKSLLNIAAALLYFFGQTNRQIDKWANIQNEKQTNKSNTVRQLTKLSTSKNEVHSHTSFLKCQGFFF